MPTVTKSRQSVLVALIKNLERASRCHNGLMRSDWAIPLSGRCRRRVLSHSDSLDLIEAHFLAPPVIELRCPRAGMVCHLCRFLQRAAVF